MINDQKVYAIFEISIICMSVRSGGSKCPAKLFRKSKKYKTEQDPKTKSEPSMMTLIDY